HKTLDKYAQLYNTHFNVIQLSQGGPMDISTTSPKVIQNLLEILEKYKDPKIVVHLFSNGGRQYYIELLRASNTEKYKHLSTAIKACIWDSAPADMDVTSGAHAGSAHIKSTWKRILTFSLMYVLIHIWFTFFRISCWFSGKDYFKEFNYLYGIDEAEKNPLQKNIPMLFLYSKADVITKHTYVEQKIQALKESGVKLIQSHRFDDSSHVAHL